MASFILLMVNEKHIVLHIDDHVQCIYLASSQGSFPTFNREADVQHIQIESEYDDFTIITLSSLSNLQYHITHRDIFTFLFSSGQI